uniref:Uncharacterized protein n=1 Tax=Meloidogyne javanica TaxID=6303 RepID=A0A915LIG7_MELJA
MASNGPVLFLLSHEYRQAYAKQFPHILHSYMGSYGNGGDVGVSPVHILNLRTAVVAPQPTNNNNFNSVVQNLAREYI